MDLVSLWFIGFNERGFDALFLPALFPHWWKRRCASKGFRMPMDGLGKEKAPSRSGRGRIYHGTDSMLRKLMGLSQEWGYQSHDYSSVSSVCFHPVLLLGRKEEGFLEWEAPPHSRHHSPLLKRSGWRVSIHRPD